ncbi:MAG: TolC family protein [Opitutaceae bacterium]|jgi:outer membrane protein TolC|nr:TolC family protein [Opitutaceae bacterium]
MSRLSFPALSLLLLAAAGPNLRADTSTATVPVVRQTPDNLPPLTLRDCVSRAVSKNFRVEMQTLTVQNARDAVESALALFDPSLSASVAYSSTQAPDGSGSGNETSTAILSLSASQKIASGGTFRLSGNIDNVDRDPATTPYNPVYDSDIALSFSQPLLKNFGSNVTRSSIAIARLGSQIADSDFKATVLQLIYEVETAYYNLAFARGQRDVRASSLDLSKRLLDENTSRRNVGVGTDLEVLQARVGVANDTRDLLLAEKNVSDQQELLLTLVGRFELDSILGNIDLGDDPEIQTDTNRSYARARAAYPDYASAELLVQQLKIERENALNKRRPNLDVDAAVGYDTRQSGFGRSITKVWGRDGYNWSVGLTLSFPWGLRAEKAQARQAAANLRREELGLERLDQEIMANVRAAVRAVETNKESLRISRLASLLSEKQYEQEKARYDAGLSTFRRVQESQQDVYAARVSELQARINLRLAIAALARLEAASLETYSITLK